MYVDNPHWEAESLAWCRNNLQDFDERSGLCRCPFPEHEDQNPSCQANSSTGHLYCHGCGRKGHFDEIAPECNLPDPPSKQLKTGGSKLKTKNTRRQAKTPRPRPANPKGVSETYDYTLADGSAHILVDRVPKRRRDGSPGKDFFPSSYYRGDSRHREGFYYGFTRPDGSNAQPVLYRLPKLSRLTPGGTIVVVEGEKDVHTAEALGLVATTNPSGAKNVDRVDWSTMEGHHVVIIPDNDAAGEERVNLLVPILAGAGVATLRVVRLPGVPEKGGDLTDWVESGGTRDQIVTLIRNTHPVNMEEVGKEEVDSPEARLKLELTKDLNLMRRRFVEGMKSRSKQFLQKANRLLLIKDEDGTYQPDEAALCMELATEFDVGTWETRRGSDYWKPAYPPSKLVSAMISAPFLFDGIKPLNFFTPSPVILRTGEITVIPGYYPTSGIYYSGKLRQAKLMPLQKAVAILRRPFLDFPFVDRSDLANALSIPLSIVCWDLYDGPPPIGIPIAPKEGSGKTLILQVAVALTTGLTLSSIEYSDDGEEFSKTLTSLMLDGSVRIILIDNIDQDSTFHSGKMCSIMTGTFLSRVLGGHELASLVNDIVWFANGNNLRVSGELTRRSFVIRIDANLEDPEERDGWEIENIQRWILQKENQEEYVTAVLSIAKAWQDAGSPRFKKRKLGSFTDYCEVIGGILEFAGIEGFLDNKDHFKSTSDPEREPWRAFARAWWDTHQHQEVTTGDLRDVVCLVRPNRGYSDLSNHRDAPLLPLGKGDIRSQTTKLGLLLGKKKGQVFDLDSSLSVKIERSEKKTSNTLYFLRPIVSGYQSPHTPEHIDEGIFDGSVALF